MPNLQSALSGLSAPKPPSVKKTIKLPSAGQARKMPGAIRSRVKPRVPKLFQNPLTTFKG